MVEYISEKPEGSFFSSSYSGVKLTEFTDTLVKNLLYNIYHKDLTIPLVQVDKLLCINDLSKPIPGQLTANYNQENNYFQFPNSLILSSVIYKDESYELSFITMIRGMFNVDYAMHITGISANASEAADLGKYLFTNSIRNSSFLNKTIIHKQVDDVDALFFNEAAFRITTPKEVNIDNIFIPDYKKDQINRFIYAVENYQSDKICLRYLMNGIPGTGKTQLINSIINSLQGKATILVCEGASVIIENIIAFCSLFEICILVIDDIDFVVADRVDARYRKSLGTFLQFFDGFIPSNLFVLASTNDKNLVDAAASRPGRFDLIIDVSEINSNNYLSLINRETTDLEIISLFTEEFLEKLKQKKITGAYLVNFIKQLRSIKQMKGEILKADFESCFEITHNGFYKTNADENPITLGFN